MSYLQGLLEGLEIDKSTKEGKALVQMAEVMSEMVLYVEDLQSQVDELTELCDILDQDLGAVEDDLYEDEDDLACGECSGDCSNCDEEDGDWDAYDWDDDSDEDDEFDFGDDDDDDELYEITCPTCGDTILLDEGMIEKIKKVSEHALDSLQIENGAAHIELKIDGDDIKIVEIGGRMGGDFIGSDLVPLSTGYDFVKAVIDVSLDQQPEIPSGVPVAYAGVNFLMEAKDVVDYRNFKEEHPGAILKEHIDSDFSDAVTDSSNRHGYYIFRY